MDANILNQFILATASVFEQVAGLKLDKEKVNVYDTGHKVKADVATIIGVSGTIKGQVIVTISEEIGMKFASAILMGEPVNEFNEMAESGVCEIANMIGGDAAQRLNKMNHVVDLTVPSVIRGKEVEIGFYPKAPVITVDFTSSWGRVQIAMRIEVGQVKPPPAG